MSEAKTKDTNVPKFRQAIDWAVAKSVKEGGRCGVCDWEPWPHNKEQSLAKHMRSKHRGSIVDLFEMQVLDMAELKPAEPGVSDDELLATAGISDIDELDKHNYLAIPTVVSQQIEEDGASGRWITEDRIEHFKQQGATLTQYNGTDLKHGSGEAGHLRANELYHVTIPHELAQRRHSLKRSRVDEQLRARGEEERSIRDDYEKKTYDYLRGERNLDHTKASQVARALTQRRERSDGGPQVRVQDARGSQEY